MKAIPATVILSLLLFGCISMGEQALNESNETQQNVTPPVINETNQSNQTIPPPKQWERYDAGEFSFEYPGNMVTSIIRGKFMGAHASEGLTTERMAVSYINTSATYGANKDGIFKDNPSKTAADFLIQDEETDPLGILDDAYWTGEVATFTISRDVYAAEVPFKLRSSASAIYSGYAISIYAPDLSLHVKVRILALDPDQAEKIRNNFILSFWLQ
ncbi:MAG: hypothetical protein PHF60_00550 [Candidatus ainarchaeum sp.]|nr:hypothetical protein [Candidatus ainarchaeum sp.]